MADATSAHALDDLLVSNLQTQDYIHLDAHGVKSLGLRNGTGETVQNEAVLAGIACQLLLDETDDDLVGNQLTGIHVAFGLEAQLGAFLDGGAESVTGGNGGNAVLCADVGCLGTLTGPGSAQKNEFHVVISSVSD